MGNALVVFAKAPVMGRAKTRLAHDLGSAVAVGLYRGWTARILRETNDPRWRRVLAVSPGSAIIARFSSWAPPRPVRLPAGESGRKPRGRGLPLPGGERVGVRGRHRQGVGDLGMRMARAVETFGPGSVVIVGSDIPDLRRTDIAAAFSALRRHDAVLGPAPDGGYWLIGLKSARLAARLRGPIRWSSPRARADTLAALGGARVAFLRLLSDIDTGADYEAWLNAGALRDAE